MVYTYKIHNSLIGGEVVFRSDGAWIPCADGNTDYQAYLAWVAEGNEAQPWE
jgi:hypothetical protein